MAAALSVSWMAGYEKDGAQAEGRGGCAPTAADGGFVRWHGGWCPERPCLSMTFACHRSGRCYLFLATQTEEQEGGEPNDRRIGKLCDYVSRSPTRIPKITEYLEQRCYKELRYENLILAKVVPCIYRKLSGFMQGAYVLEW